MAIETITVIKDDLDGGELPSDTKPFDLTYEGTTYRLYLSEPNLGTVKATLGGWTKTAETTRAASAPRARAARVVGNRPYDPAELREWATEEGLVKPGHRGRFKQDVIDAFLAYKSN